MNTVDSSEGESENIICAELNDVGCVTIFQKESLTLLENVRTFFSL
jgi:hypothetical protein